jgi:hypothetical protein
MRKEEEGRKRVGDALVNRFSPNATGQAYTKYKIPRKEGSGEASALAY